MHENQFMLLLNDMKRKLLLFLYTISVVQYFIFQYDNWFSSFLILFFSLHINVIY